MSKHAYHWYIPLPEPLPLPSGAPIPEEHIDVLTRGRAHISLRPFSISQVHPQLETWRYLFALASHLHSSLPQPDQKDSEEGPRGDTTVVEITAQFGDDVPSEGELSDTFDHGLELIRALQRAYYLATKDPVSLVTAEQLPTTQLLIHADGHNASSGMFVLHPASMRASTLPDALNSKQLQQLDGILSSLNQGGVFWPYADLRREALVAMWMRGDYRSSALAAATAAEVFLDTVLLHMLWVEGSSPEEAATVFKDTSLTKRVKRDYFHRLGGKWDLAGSDPVSRWHATTATLRNRVAHAGYEPDREETRVALQGTLELEVHLMDLVCTPPRLHTFIKTALEITGLPGIEKRGRMNKRVRRLIDKTPQEELDPFHGWRDAVVDARD